MALYEWKQDGAFRNEIIPTLHSVYLEGLFAGCPFPVVIMEGKWDLTWGADKADKFQGCFPGSKLVMFELAGTARLQMPPGVLPGTANVCFRPECTGRHRGCRMESVGCEQD